MIEIECGPWEPSPSLQGVGGAALPSGYTVLFQSCPALCGLSRELPGVSPGSLFVHRDRSAQTASCPHHLLA